MDGWMDEWIRWMDGIFKEDWKEEGCFYFLVIFMIGFFV